MKRRTGPSASGVISFLKYLSKRKYGQHAPSKDADLLDEAIYYKFSMGMDLVSIERSNAFVNALCKAKTRAKEKALAIAFLETLY